MRFTGKIRVLLCVLMLIAMAVTLVACSAPADDGGQPSPDAEEKSIFAIEYRGIVIELGKNASTILSKLGNPKSEQFVASCGEGAGDQWMYDFGSVILYTVKDGKSETVDAVALRDDSAETLYGISIGSSEDEMTKAYGEAKVDGQKRRYQKGGKTLEFRLDENEKIVSAELRVES